MIYLEVFITSTIVTLVVNYALYKYINIKN